MKDEEEKCVRGLCRGMWEAPLPGGGGGRGYEAKARRKINLDQD